MISTPDPQTAVALINDAIPFDAWRTNGCFELEISDRSLRRWQKTGSFTPVNGPSRRARHPRTS